MTGCEYVGAILAQAPGQPGFGDMLRSFAPLIIIIVAFFWLMSRSQKKKDQKREEMLSSIKPKDKVVTIGGICGQVVTVKPDVFVLRVDNEKDVRVTVSRSGISRKLEDEGESE